MTTLLDRYSSRIVGTIGCFDRVVIQGTLPVLCFADGMASILRARGMKLFDYPKFAEPFRDQIRANAEALAAEAGIEIEFMRKTTFRKDDRIAEILKAHGDHPGLVAILSAMEACHTYRPWHDKNTGKTMLRPDMGKCLHYYFYFLDPEVGLCYVRVPTWCPFRLQFYFNGHNQLAIKLREAGIAFRMMDNAFSQVADIEGVQKLSDDQDAARLHALLDRYATRCCPPVTALETIETTVNDVTFFRHHRTVEQRDGTNVFKLAPLRKSIYSLGDLRGLLAAANRRYLEFISALEDPTSGGKALRRITEPVTVNGRCYRGFNFFSDDDRLLFEAIARGEFNISGMRNKDLQKHLPGKAPAWISRCLKRLRVHGLIKRVGRTYKHYLTDLGRRAVIGGLKVIQMALVPALATAPAFG